VYKKSEVNKLIENFATKEEVDNKDAILVISFRNQLSDYLVNQKITFYSIIED
jgi:hypothetical protein